MIYAFYPWDVALRLRQVRWVAAALVIAGLISQLAIASRNLTDRSLYTNRVTVVRAIQEKNSHLVGERRTGTWEVGR
jgi:hypothetical protein